MFLSLSLSLVSTKIFRRGFRRGSDYRYHFRAIGGVTKRGMFVDSRRVQGGIIQDNKIDLLSYVYEKIQGLRRRSETIRNWQNSGWQS